MKASKNCECCSSKSKCIVITIETCCKKNCEEYKKSHGVKMKGDESDRDVKHVSSGPVVMQRSSSGKNDPTKTTSGVRPASSSSGIKRDPSSGEVRGASSSSIRGSPSSGVRETSSSGVKEPSSSAVRGTSSSGGLREREDSTKPTIDDEGKESVEEVEDLSPSYHDSRHDKRLKSKSSVSKSKERRIFKLPLLVERHHGPGCAMEISVLEKHDDTCLYKKEGTEGRNEVDDRAGSYDCIGRLVFRTCNTSEAESDTSKLTVHGGSMGPEKSNVEMTHSGIKEKSAEKILDQDEEDSVHSDPTQFESGRESQLQDLTSKSQEGSFGSAKESLITSSKEEQLMTAKVATVQDAKPRSKKHYPGDGCKLHPPKTPSFLMNSSVIDQASVSKKVFTVFTEKGNQTETKLDVIHDRESSSQETIASLNDFDKPEEKPRRPSFLGALFRRSSAGKSRI